MADAMKGVAGGVEIVSVGSVAEAIEAVGDADAMIFDRAVIISIGDSRSNRA